MAALIRKPLDLLCCVAPQSDMGKLRLTPDLIGNACLHINATDANSDHMFEFINGQKTPSSPSQETRPADTPTAESAPKTVV
ncbi:hypothetical protein M3Y99_00798200 [Aphelenchoides fujianensis]|nr:hypothetical protein M3Y99_00798200 [Aphelenchoides fujianensis]